MISGKILRDAIISGANNINNQRSRVDELNVFPVPDGDTGTNMGMTIGASVRELQALDDSCTVAEASKTAASAMLRGARGNSGVITSLLFRGFSKALEGKKEADVADIVAALKKGVEGAYKAVMKPTEGTILTVARVASEEAAASDAADIPALWDVVLSAGQKALEDTPNLLPVLKKAGVVDAGGQGIMIIFEGMGKVFHGEAIVEGGEPAPNKAKLSTENAGKGVFTDDLMKEEKNAKDEDVLVSLQLVNEMLVRGYEFLPIELGKSRGSHYIVEDGKVRLPFSSLKGLGGAAADALERSTIHGEEYLSMEELQQASGVSSAILDRLRQVGALGDLPESSQVSFF